MSCPHCQKAALSNAKFCRQCGQRVGINCPACAAPNPPESRFCGECGSALPGTSQLADDTESENARVVSQGQRRHLTILFTDLTGYTRMMEEYDPEDVQTLMASITDSSIQIIKAYHGHIERIIGDEILALFGLPTAHEDDAIRTIKAASEIHTSVMNIKPATIHLREPVAMHTGINTGLVVTARSTPVDGAFDLFDFTPVGLAVLFAGAAYMAFVGRHLLPRRGSGLASEENE